MINQVMKNRYLSTKDAFKRYRLFFNMKVEEKLLEEQKTEPLRSDGYDSYENAKFLIEYFPEIVKICEQTKNKYPKYGEKRLKKKIIEAHQAITQDNLDDYFCGYSFESLIESYFLYKSCGFSKVAQKEQEFHQVSQELEQTFKDFCKDSKSAFIQLGSSAKEYIKPYTSLLKEQLKEAKRNTTKMFYKERKRLVRKLNARSKKNQ